MPRRGHDVTFTDKLTAPDTASVDITEFGQVSELLRTVKHDYIHLAAISRATGKNEQEQGPRQPQEKFKVNALGAANVLEARRIHDMRPW